MVRHAERTTGDRNEKGNTWSDFGVGCCACSRFPGLDSPCRAVGQSAQTDNNIQAELQNSFKKFKGVQISVKNGIVDLEGTVKDFATKEELDKKAHRIKNVVAVRNKLQIAGAGEVSDAQLQQKIVQKLQYDRVGYGNAFNAISVNVQNGVVTLGGNALGPVAADSAVSLASHFPGVQDVINNIQVDPLSPMDDRTRLQVYRAIYGFPSLNKYAIDPAQPIRITVVNGNVTLNGVVLKPGRQGYCRHSRQRCPGSFQGDQQPPGSQFLEREIGLAFPMDSVCGPLLRQSKRGPLVV